MKKFISIFIMIMALTPNAFAADNYRDLSAFPKWRKVMREAPLKFTRERPVSTKDLERINTFYNVSINYKPDANGMDYWQTPSETEKLKTGDCEDYSIAKYYALAELGVKPSDMLIVVGYHYVEADIHSVLQVRLNGRTYVLDLRHHGQLSDDRLKDARKYYNTEFSPAYGVNHERWTRKPLE